MAGQIAAALPRPSSRRPGWLEGEEPRGTDLNTASLGLPGVLLTQLATIDLLAPRVST